MPEMAAEDSSGTKHSRCQIEDISIKLKGRVGDGTMRYGSDSEPEMGKDWCCAKFPFCKLRPTVDKLASIIQIQSNLTQGTSKAHHQAKAKGSHLACSATPALFPPPDGGSRGMTATH